MIISIKKIRLIVMSRIVMLYGILFMKAKVYGAYMQVTTTRL